MATFIKRNGKFQVQIRRKGFPVQCRTFHLKSDAVEWARFMERKADRGELPAPSKELVGIKLSTVIERYLTEVSVTKRSFDNEAPLLKAFLRQPIASVALSNLTPAHFQSYRELRLLKVRNGTVNRELGIVGHALDLASTEWGIPLQNNPLKKLRKLKVQNARERRLSEDELILLMSKITTSRNPYIKSLVLFAIESGMRRGEILRIEWKDINFTSRTLHIPRTKNGYSRTIPLSNAALTILDKLKTEQADDRPFPLSDNAAKLSWQRLLRRCKIDDLHFHDFRHEAISRFFEQGLSVPEVALISGHRDFKMLFRYTHMTAEKIARKMNEKLD